MITFEKNIVVGDIIAYVIFPLLIWNICRDLIGDYYAMLVSSVPGIMYSVYRFVLIKKVNIFGIFIITNLSLVTLVDILSGSAIQLLWNNVYYSFAMGALVIFTVIINKPLVLFFTLDFVEVQGKNRKKMKSMFIKKFLTLFKFITLGFAFRDILLAFIRMWLIGEYGVEAFDKGLVVRQLLSWGLTGLSLLGFVYLSKLLKEHSNRNCN